MKTQPFDVVDVYKQNTSTVLVLRTNKLPNGTRSNRNNENDGNIPPPWRKK